MGMIIYLICKSKKVVVDRPAYYSVAGIIMFLFIAIDSVLSINYFLEWAIILYGFASSLIIFGLVRAEDKGQTFGAGSWMQLLGNSSYALYLIHVPIISILCKLSISLHLNDLGVLGAIISYFYILVACLISSIVFHVWIEKPIVLYLRKLYIPSTE
jgi:peptidoglycan/LPS O-acetylase OafA/YrhL